MGQSQSSDFDEFTNGHDAKFSEGWTVSKNNETSWDPMIRGEGRTGYAYINEDNDAITTNRTADILVPDSMKSGFLIHLPWSNCRDFDILGVLKSGKEVFIRRVNAYQNVRNNDTEGYHDAIAMVPIPRVDRFTHIRIRGVRGRVHYMGMGWSMSITASGAESGFVSSRNIMGSALQVGGDSTPVPQDWTGLNLKRRDGRWSHFDWKDDQKNYIRGETIVDDTMFFNKSANFNDSINIQSGKVLSLRDQHHGLAFAEDADGPSLYGYSGGKLRVSGKDSPVDILKWTRSGVDISGNTTISGNLVTGGEKHDDWTGVNLKRRDGRWSHFDWKDDQKNYIRGETIVDDNINFAAGKSICLGPRWCIVTEGRDGEYLVFRDKIDGKRYAMSPNKDADL